MTMRLSTAIRLGSLLKPQEFGGEGYHGRSCALRAAAEAVGIVDDWGGVLDYAAIQQRWPWIGTSLAIPTRSYCALAMDTIVFLNDEERWTREQIADWVQGQEEAHAPTMADPAPVKVSSLDK